MSRVRCPGPLPPSILSKHMGSLHFLLSSHLCQCGNNGGGAVPRREGFYRVFARFPQRGQEIQQPSSEIFFFFFFTYLVISPFYYCHLSPWNFLSASKINSASNSSFCNIERNLKCLKIFITLAGRRKRNHPRPGIRDGSWPGDPRWQGCPVSTFELPGEGLQQVAFMGDTAACSSATLPVPCPASEVPPEWTQAAEGARGLLHQPPLGPSFLYTTFSACPGTQHQCEKLWAHCGCPGLST